MDRTIALLTVLFFAVAETATAQTTSVEGQARAKALIVLTAEVPTKFGSNFAIELLLPNGDFVQPAWGMPRGYNYIHSSEVHGALTLWTVIIGPGFGGSPPDFVITDQGQAQLQWVFQSPTAGEHAGVVDQIVNVLPQSKADRDFLSQAGAPGILERLFGEEEVAKGFPGDTRPVTSDQRALFIISYFMKGSQAELPERAVQVRDIESHVDRWAEITSELATRVPTSCYAPYASHMAGMCYLALARGAAAKAAPYTSEPGHASRFAKQMQQEPNTAKAKEALEFAVANGDSYVRPRSLIQLALLQYNSGEDEAGAATLERALAESPGEGTISKRVGEFRGQIAHSASEQQSSKPSQP